MRNSRPRQHRGFTLVEMLVVIVIIGILAAILVPTVAMAIRKSKNAAIALEVNNLASAIESYKAKFGDYPPDFTDLTAFQNHMKKAFPRHAHNLNPAAAGSWFTSPPWSGAAPTVDPRTLDAAEALVFWLSAVKTSARTPLDVDNTHPNTSVAFDRPGDAVSFFDFDLTRLIDVDNDGWAEYASAYSPDAPYVYFDGRLQGGSYIYTSAVYPSNAVDAGVGVARPYRTNQQIDEDDTRTQPNDAYSGGSPNPASINGTTWIDPGKFQIICPGQDNNFGVDLLSGTTVVYKQFPDPNGGTEEDQDNIANFSDGQTMEEAVP